jgi:hypothetical protein
MGLIKHDETNWNGIEELNRLSTLLMHTATAKNIQKHFVNQTFPQFVALIL